MQHTLTKPHGKIFLSFLLVLLLLLSGCQFWGTTEMHYAFPNGYFVSRINGRQITIALNKYFETDPEDLTGVTVIKQFYVKGFCNNERYVGLFGTHTQLHYATDDEIESGAIQYYLIDTETKTIYGPYIDQSEYEKFLQEINCVGLSDWLETKDYIVKWDNHYRENE